MTSDNHKFLYIICRHLSPRIHRTLDPERLKYIGYKGRVLWALPTPSYAFQTMSHVLAHLRIPVLKRCYRVLKIMESFSTHSVWTLCVRMSVSVCVS